MSCFLYLLVKIVTLFKKDQKTTWEISDDFIKSQLQISIQDRIDYSLLDSFTPETTLKLDEERRKKEQLKKDFTSGDPTDIVLGKGEFTYYPTVEESKLNPMDFFPKSEDMKLVLTSEETTNKSAIEEEEEKEI